MEGWIDTLVDSMYRYIGQTVTIFTTSGGLSGDGFTGVLIAVDCNAVRLLCNVGEAPSCPIGSNCTNAMTPYGVSNNSLPYSGTNPLGSVAVIPICAIACFAHNAI